MFVQVCPHAQNGHQSWVSLVEKSTLSNNSAPCDIDMKYVMICIQALYIHKSGVEKWESWSRASSCGGF